MEGFDGGVPRPRDLGGQQRHNHLFVPLSQISLESLQTASRLFFLAASPHAVAVGGELGNGLELVLGELVV